jgi:hypothetical protein
MKAIVPIFALSLVLAAPAMAADPCKQIVQQCQSSGFVAGQWKKGYGLWKDCVRPILGDSRPSGITKQIPSVSPAIVAACKAKNPKFGEGKEK